MDLKPRVLETDNGHVLSEKDEEVIYEAIKVLFPTVDSTEVETARGEYIRKGFSDFAHFGLLNWYNLLSRGRHWKALNYLSYWAIDFFKCGIAHEGAQQSFMRKQARVLWALSQGESLPVMQFMTYGGRQFSDPKDVTWGWRRNLTTEELEVISSVIVLEPKDQRKEKRTNDPESEEEPEAKRVKN